MNKFKFYIRIILNTLLIILLTILLIYISPFYISDTVRFYYLLIPTYIFSIIKLIFDLTFYIWFFIKNKQLEVSYIIINKPRIIKLFSNGLLILLILSFICYCFSLPKYYDKEMFCEKAEIIENIEISAYQIANNCILENVEYQIEYEDQIYIFDTYVNKGKLYVHDTDGMEMICSEFEYASNLDDMIFNNVAEKYCSNITESYVYNVANEKHQANIVKNEINDTTIIYKYIPNNLTNFYSLYIYSENSILYIQERWNSNIGLYVDMESRANEWLNIFIKLNDLK